jgi:hypothetical protein
VNLGCSIAAEGNSRIDGGAAPADVRSAVVRAHNTNQAAYDKDSGHSCDAGQQASWEQRIDNLASRWLP